MIPRFQFRTSVAAVLAALVQLHALALTTEEEFFEKRIRPVLSESCYECHSASSKKLRGKLKVDSREALIKGGETGPAILPGKPQESLLFRAIAHLEKEMEMPPKKPKFSDAILADFEKWIRSGAVWPGTETAASKPGDSAAKSRDYDLETRKARLPWIWETPSRPAIPDVHQQDWPGNPIDRFILARLEKEGLHPAPAAEANLWLRRVYFTLTGLPPSPSELKDFLSNPSAENKERVVDRLLASPRFGERWGRHWLDLVRYAESRGHESDYIIPNAYEYRDYVIRALNQDVRYDRFIEEHIAGDLLPHPRRNLERGFNESLLATGWAYLGEEIHAPVDTRLDETERVDNRIDVFSKTFLGLTVSCARCHDHKFDAISQKDYYALAGFFISTGQRLARFETFDAEAESARRLRTIRQQQRATLAEKLSVSSLPVFDRLRSYLVAAGTAAKAVQQVPAGKSLTKPDLSAAACAQIRKLASDHSLDPETLLQWTLAICNVGSNPADPLHPFNAVVLGKTTPKTPDPGWNPDLPRDARVIVDYSRLQPGEWMSDGFAFGLGPLRPGDILLNANETNRNQTIQLATRGAAVFDPLWKRAALKPGVEREPTIFGGWKRDGTTLRTPKFELRSGKLHYLVRGSGRVVAAVDSQRLITGPVHTGLVREWKSQDQWFWFTHDLSDYKGHRVSVEFSPGTEQDTSIALVVESETAPTAPATAGQQLAGLLQKAGVESLDAAAAVYEEAFRQALGSVKENRVDGPDCNIAAWLAGRPELFSGVPQQWPNSLVEVLANCSTALNEAVRSVDWAAKTAPAMMEGNGVNEFLLVRGKHFSPRGEVPRRFLEAVSGDQPITSQGGSGRLELAKTLASPSNPLVARVFVNRVWHQVFGRGIVPTVDNFGWLGLRPSHPELLDYLADSFVHEDAWSLKSLLKRLVLSSTYAQSSRPSDAAAEEKDPENALLHRMNLKRLEAESIRDSILAVSGRLDLRMYGPSIPLHPSQFMEARGLRSERGPLDGSGRRSIYVAARRNFLPMMMTAFDLPIPFTTVGRRNVSNVPGQMLFLMNDPFVHEQAGVWARRLNAASSGTPNPSQDRESIRQLYLTAFSREPSAVETDRCLANLAEARSLQSREGADVEPWTELCHALIGVKEFIFIR